VLVDRIDPTDDAGLAEGAAVLAASDHDLWPELSGFSLRDIRAFARFTGKSKRYLMVAARAEHVGPILGVGLLEFPLLDNTHSVEFTVAVHPRHRRHGAGSAIVEHVGELARAEGRHSLNSLVDVPVARARDHASLSFASALGFVATMRGHGRRLDLPLDPLKTAELWSVVSSARQAADYRMLTFRSPWPEEEFWDGARMAEGDGLLRQRGATKVCAVAQHAPSGRVVAMTEILVCDDEPQQSWQLNTVVHPEHRGHRLGLAVKLANLEFLARHSPGIRFVVTGNAAVNAPMIAVNDMMGFRIQGEGTFWQKHLDLESV
jgi:GNAT superfamily N-acetyltransferase